MNEAFLTVLNMSLSAGILVAAVLVLRILLKRVPKFITLVLWAFVAVRLICPFSLESAVSLVPDALTVPMEIVHSSSASSAADGSSPFAGGSSAAPEEGSNAVAAPASIQSGDSSAADGTAAEKSEGIFTFATAVWLSGISAVTVYTAISYLRLRKKVRISIPLKENIMQCDCIDTPFILGFIKPKIYLPSDLDAEQTDCVLAHEKTHLKYFDHVWKLFGFGIAALHWFNPLVWLAFVLFCRDTELCCDERVIKRMSLEEKKAYSTALLSCSCPRKAIAACPLAFGEANVKERIKTVLSYKKPAFWVTVIAVIACIVVAVCFLTNRKSPVNEPGTAQTEERTEQATECKTELETEETTEDPQVRTAGLFSTFETMRMMSGFIKLSLETAEEGTAGPYDGRPASELGTLYVDLSSMTYKTASAEDMPKEGNRIILQYNIGRKVDTDTESIMNTEILTFTFWESSNYFSLKTDSEEIRYYCAVSEYGFLGQGLREWFDESEYKVLSAVENVIPDRGQGYVKAAQEYCEHLYGKQLIVSSGSRYKYTFVTCKVSANEKQTELSRNKLYIDENTYCFSVENIFVPENDKAQLWGMAGSGTEYSGSDPGIPGGAYKNMSCGYAEKTDNGWKISIVGTSW